MLPRSPGWPYTPEHMCNTRFMGHKTEVRRGAGRGDIRSWCRKWEVDLIIFIIYMDKILKMKNNFKKVGAYSTFSCSLTGNPSGYMKAYIWAREMT